jgi:hypothetical protein
VRGAARVWAAVVAGTPRRDRSAPAERVVRDEYNLGVARRIVALPRPCSRQVGQLSSGIASGFRAIGISPR